MIKLILRCFPQTLRQLGATQMLLGGAEEEAETSLLRAARLGASGIDEAKVEFSLE